MRDLLLLTFLIYSFAAALGASAQSLQPSLAIENPKAATPVGNDNFGVSVVQIDATRVAAGAPFDDPMDSAGTPVSNAGSVYMLDRATGALLQAIRNPNTQGENDRFGSSIALAEPAAGQKLLIVGAPGFDSPGRPDAGAVYLIDIDGTAPPLRLLAPTPRSGAQFGLIVRALGSYVVVGAPLDDPQNIANAGSVSLYRVSKSTSNTIEALPIRTPESPFPVAGDRFGTAVALRHTGDEPDVTVGTPGYDLPGRPDAGRVYVFRGGNLRLTLQAPPVDQTWQDNFGTVVTIRGDEIVVGTPGFDNLEATNTGRVYVFDGTLENGELGAGYPLLTIENPEPRSATFFGTAVAASATFLAVSAPGATVDGHGSAGIAYVFPPSGGFALTIANPAPARNDRFGNQLAAVGVDLLIGVPFDQYASGVIFLYSAAGAKLLEVPNPEPPTLSNTTDAFGASIAQVRRGMGDPRGTGLDLVIGAPLDDPFGVSDAGSAYLVDGDNANLLAVMHNPTAIVGAFFGMSVGAADRLIDDPRGGQDVLVGSMRNDVHRQPTVVESVEPGAAYLYDGATRGDAPDADIVFLHPEMPSEATDIEHYGAQVLGIGDKIIISSMFGNYRAPDQNGREGYGSTVVHNTGAVFVLDRSDPANPLPPVIQDPSRQPINHFGGNSIQSIARVSREADDPRGPGFDLLISASLYDDGTASNTGRAYLFDGLTRELLLTIKNPTPQSNEMFGATVAAMGTNLVIGAPGDFYPGSTFRSGAVYVFDGTLRGETSAPILTIVKQYPNLTAGAGDGFGGGLAVLGDDIIVGAPNDTDPDGPGGIPAAFGAGAVFVFDGRLRNSLGDPPPAPLAIVENPDEDNLPSPTQPKGNDGFGAFLTPLGGRFAVGAPADDRRNPNGTVDEDAGAVYVYNWDTTPPVITSVVPSIGALWPANHQMVPVTIAVTASDAIDPAPACSIRNVVSNEPINGLGDGDSTPDWQFGPNSLHVNLRAERSNTGMGRAYTITIACADNSDNTSTRNTFVTVPHDLGK